MAKVSKQSKSRMSESARLAQVLMHCTGTGIYIVQDGKFQYVNSLFQELAGYTEQELIGMRSLDLVHPEDRDAVRERAIENLKGHHPLPYEYRFIRKNGEVMWVLERLSSIEYRGKRAAVGSFMDITDRKLMEQALADEATRRRILVDQSRDGIHVLDSEGKVVEANKRFAEMLGYSPEEVRELHMWDWDTQFTREELLGMVRSVDAAGDHFETQQRRKDGTVIDVELSTNGAEIAGQKLVFCVCRDITERKRAEEALRLSEQTFRDSIENSPLGIRILDKDGKTLYANRMLLDLCGFSSLEEMEAVPEDKRYTAESYAEHMERIEKARRGEPVPPIYETSIVRIDCEVVILSASRKKLLWGGQECFQVVYQDITERKQAEEALADEAMRRRMLMENSIDGISVLDENCKLVEANKRFDEMLGYSPEEVRELHVWDWDTDHTREEVLEMARTVDEAGQKFETRHRRKDGTYLDVELCNNGVVVGGKKLIYCVSRDITERKKAEEALRRSEQNFHDVIENSPLGIRVLNKEGKTLYANRALLNFWGYNSLEELEAVPRKQRYTPQTYAEHLERLEKRKRGEPAPLSYETGIVRSDGQIRILSVSRGELLWNGEKQFQIVSQDITEYKRLEEALAKSEERYRTVLEQMEEAYYEVDISGNFTFFNDAMCRQLGYSREELIGMNYRKCTPEADVQRVFKAFNQVYRTGKPIKGIPMGWVKKDGTRIFAETSAFPLRNASGEIIGFRGIVLDVTERAQMIKALSESEERYRTILAEIEEGYYEVNLAGDFTFVNDATCRQLGYSREELIGMNYMAYVLKEETKGIYKAWNKVYRTGKSLRSYPFTCIRKDGTQVFLESSVSPLRSNEGRIIGFRSISRDVTEHKQFERRLEEMATHDSLTGLPNRVLLSDRFMIALALSRRTRNRLAVLMLDLDRFKAVNDSLGHDVGDQLLKAVGKRLLSTMRKSDTIARIGGDEFVLVLPQISQVNEAAKLSQRILEAFREPFVCDDRRLHITTSIGVAVYPEHGEDIESLLKNADTAMYRAKEQGRNIYKLYDGEALTLLAKQARVRA
jgi:diguanylate cyclase (GGDEF)-like protein/PAS domain S-box-containing protein